MTIHLYLCRTGRHLKIINMNTSFTDQPQSIARNSRNQICGRNFKSKFRLKQGLEKVRTQLVAFTLVASNFCRLLVFSKSSRGQARGDSSQLFSVLYSTFSVEQRLRPLASTGATFLKSKSAGSIDPCVWSFLYKNMCSRIF